MLRDHIEQQETSHILCISGKKQVGKTTVLEQELLRPVPTKHGNSPRRGVLSISVQSANKLVLALNADPNLIPRQDCRPFVVAACRRFHAAHGYFPIITVGIRSGDHPDCIGFELLQRLRHYSCDHQVAVCMIDTSSLAGPQFMDWQFSTYHAVVPELSLEHVKDLVKREPLLASLSKRTGISVPSVYSIVGGVPGLLIEVALRTTTLARLQDDADVDFSRYLSAPPSHRAALQALARAPYADGLCTSAFNHASVQLPLLPHEVCANQNALYFDPEGYKYVFYSRAHYQAAQKLIDGS